MYKLLCGHVFTSFEHISGVEFLGHVIDMFNRLRNCQTVLQSDCPILRSHQQWMRVPVPPHIHEHCLFSCFYYSYYRWCEVVAYLWFWFAFLWRLMMVNIFLYVSVIPNFGFLFFHQIEIVSLFNSYIVFH